MNQVLELRAVSKQFPNHKAVDDVSLSVTRGAFFALVGPSGCGKTTILRMIAGFETPTAGEVLLNGEPIAHLQPYERNVSTVFQSYALFPHLTARQNIEFGLRRRGVTQLTPAVDRVLHLVHLTGKESRYPHQMSGGERQRVALARSLVLQPDLLLLDEPLSALDPQLRKQVRHELKSLQRDTGITFLMVTHDQEEALSMADEIAVIHQGRAEQVGSPQQIYSRPATRFVAGFLGDINWLGDAGIRPEAIRVSLQPPGSAATVRTSTFLGNRFHLSVDLAGTTIVCESDTGFAPGQPVFLSWRKEDEIHLP
jgi:ABC-type Fe3+/spermidine/putrescine transport system ATPase subunit